MRDEIKKIVGHGRVDAVSAATNTNLMETMVKIKKMIDELPPEPEPHMKVTKRPEPETSEVQKIGPGEFMILPSSGLKKAVGMTNWDYEEAVERFYRILEATGVRSLLKGVWVFAAFVLSRCVFLAENCLVCYL